MEWFRSYSKKIHDPRFNRLSHGQFGLYHKLECVANSEPDRDGSIAFGSTDAAQWFSNVMTMRIQSACNALAKFEKVGLITIDEGAGKIFLTRWHDEQKPSDNVAERVRKHREKKRYGNVQIDRERDRETQQGSLPISNSFLDNSGGEDANGFSLEVSPIDTSPSPEEEKPKDTFKEKEELPWEVDIVPPPSTERKAVPTSHRELPPYDGAAMAKSIYHLTAQVAKRPGSSEIIIDVQKLMHSQNANSSQFRMELKRSLNHVLMFADDSPHSDRVYFRMEMEERKKSWIIP